MAHVALSIGLGNGDRPGRRRARFLLGLMLLALAGCQASAPATPSAALGESPAPSTDATDQANATDAPDAQTPPPDDGNIISQGLAWLIGLAPGAPSGPDEVNAYLLLQEHSRESCGEVLDQTLPEDSQTLYHGAAAACLAALHGRSARWAEAEAAYDALDGQPEGCLNRATYALLESVVTAYRENPTAEFRVAQSSTLELPCPSIENVRVTRDTEGALQVGIRGDRLRRVEAVGFRFVDCPAEIPELDDHGRTEDFTSDRRSLQATIGADAVPPDATTIWIGLVANPDPWIAAAACVPIEPAEDGNPPTEEP